MQPKLAIVIPCYNEEEVLPITCKLFVSELLLLQKKALIAKDSIILFVNDGSKDRTWEIIRELAREYECIRGISLSRNRGHQNALLAGLMEVKDEFDITITIDCDGQDDISVMEEMVSKYLNGAEIVYGVRNNRDSDTCYKRWTAHMFYKILNILGVEVVYNHADYRLVSAKVLKEFSDFHEVNLFLRGMFPLVGFSCENVYYKRAERMVGESHYSVRKMFALAFDGITSLSIKPIRMITVFGLLVSVMSLVGIVWLTILFFLGKTVNGWAGIVCAICFWGGAQLTGIGIIGEYIGKIYMETKARPRFIISDRIY